LRRTGVLYSADSLSVREFHDVPVRIGNAAVITVDRTRVGGEIRFDGEPLRKDGMFVSKDLQPLNPENLK